MSLEKTIARLAEPLAQETREGFSVLLTALVGIGDLLAAEATVRTSDARAQWDELRLPLLDEAERMKGATQ